MNYYITMTKQYGISTSALDCVKIKETRSRLL